MFCFVIFLRSAVRTNNKKAQFFVALHCAYSLHEMDEHTKNQIEERRAFCFDRLDSLIFYSLAFQNVILETKASALRPKGNLDSFGFYIPIAIILILFSTTLLPVCSMLHVSAIERAIIHCLS